MLAVCPIGNRQWVVIHPLLSIILSLSTMILCACRCWMKTMSLATLSYRCQWYCCSTAHHHSAMPVTISHPTIQSICWNQWSDIAGSWHCLLFFTRSLTYLLIAAIDLKTLRWLLKKFYLSAHVDICDIFMFYPVQSNFSVLLHFIQKNIYYKLILFTCILPVLSILNIQCIAKLWIQQLTLINFATFNFTLQCICKIQYRYVEWWSTVNLLQFSVHCTRPA